MTTYDVFVGQISLTTTESDLQEHFKRYGHISSCSLFDSKRSGDATKYGFLRFSEEENAHQACSENGKQFQGSKLTVRFGEKRGSGGRSSTSKSSNDSETQRGGWQSRQIPPAIGIDSSSDSIGISTGTGPASAENDVKETWFVTQVDGPCMFWAQNVANHDQLVELAENLKIVCPSATQTSGQPQSNKVYAAKFSEDQQWYRCQVLETISETSSKVQYVDFGNMEIIDNREILDLPNSLASVKPMASRYVLYGLKPVYTDRSSAGFCQGRDRLSSLIQDQLIKAVSKAAMAKSVTLIPAIVEVGDIDVNQRMLDEGFGERRFLMNPGRRIDASGGMQAQMAQTQLQSRPQDSPPPMNWKAGFNQIENLKGPRNVGNCWNSKTDNSFNRPTHQQNSGYGGGDSVPDANNFMSPPVSLPPPNSGIIRHDGPLQKELLDLKREYEHLQQATCMMQQQKNLDIDGIEKERNTALLELATLRGQLKVREQEMTTQLREADLTFRLSSLANGVEKIRLLRKQFPTDPEIRDNMEYGIQTVTDSNQVISLSKLSIISQVQTALASYNSCQEKIKDLNKDEDYQDLVQKRDEARCDLHATMQEFCTIVDKLPLDKRRAQLQDCMESLKQTHQRFLQSDVESMMDVKVALQLYIEWKNARRAAFEESRTSTNTCHNELECALRQIQKCLTLDVVNSSQKTSCIGLDNLLVRFNLAIIEEVKNTDMITEGRNLARTEDVNFISILVKTLLNSMQKEMSDIECFLQYKHEWSNIKDILSKWLTDVPDVSELKKLRTVMKTLKSRLRHKLADKLDLEEEGESAEEIAVVEAELNSLRKEFHEQIIREHEYMGELASLNDQHFPELGRRYPDLHIDKFSEFNGLLCSSVNLEHFSILPLEGLTKKSVFGSVFDGKPVVLKEYIIDDSLGVKRDDFLQRALNYHNIPKKNLMPLHSVFFLKSERQAYVQLPKYNSSLHQILGTTILSEQCVQSLLCGLLAGIEALHNASLIHGAIHPNNVFFSEDDGGILAEFDFSRSLTQRVMNPYVAPNGMTFKPPEANYNLQSLTQAIDMYNFGLITLLLTYPGGPSKSYVNGKMQFLDSSHPVATIIESLLCDDCGLRPSASQLRTHPFFSTSYNLDQEKSEPTTLQLTKTSPSSTIHSPGTGILKNYTPHGTPSENLECDKNSLSTGESNEIIQDINTEPFEASMPSNCIDPEKVHVSIDVIEHDITSSDIEKTLVETSCNSEEEIHSSFAKNPDEHEFNECENIETTELLDVPVISDQDVEPPKEFKDHPTDLLQDDFDHEKTDDEQDFETIIVQKSPSPSFDSAAYHPLQSHSKQTDSIDQETSNITLEMPPLEDIDTSLEVSQQDDVCLEEITPDNDN